MKTSSNIKQGDVVANKYRLDQPIGEGNMGMVWAGTTLATGDVVALKFVLNPTHDLRQRLLREAKACGSLVHPNIVRLFDVGETVDGAPFLVLELLSGETLGRVIKTKRRIEPPVAARIARDIARALVVAHRAKFVHRDLKPANIFLHRPADIAADEFVVKVLDFGISKHIGATDDVLTATGIAVGSPAYMSPEQVCVRKDIDHRSDLWSLGIVLYEMLTGARPFEGPVDQLVRNIVLADIVLPSSRVRSIPREFDEVIRRCLERDRGKRIAHAEDLIGMLEPLVEAGQSMRVLVNVPGATPADKPDEDAEATTVHLAPHPSSVPPLAPTKKSDRLPFDAAAPPSIAQVTRLSTVTPSSLVQRPSRPSTTSLATPKYTPTGTELLTRGVAETALSDKPIGSPTGTAHLAPDAEPGDPFAALRHERQRMLAAYHQSTQASEGGAQNGALGISVDALRPSVPNPSSTASASLPLSVVVGIADGASTRKRHKGRLIVAVGVGVVAGLALIGALLSTVLSRSRVTPEVAAGHRLMTRSVDISKIEVPSAPSAKRIVEPLPAPHAETNVAEANVAAPAPLHPATNVTDKPVVHPPATRAAVSLGTGKLAQKQPPCVTNCRRRSGNQDTSNFFQLVKPVKAVDSRRAGAAR